MIRSIHTCDRCGATSGPTDAKNDAPLTTHFSVIGLPDSFDADLCDPCRVIVTAAIRVAIRHPAKVFTPRPSDSVLS